MTSERLLAEIDHLTRELAWFKENMPPAIKALDEEEQEVERLEAENARLREVCKEMTDAIEIWAIEGTNHGPSLGMAFEMVKKGRFALQPVKEKA